MRLLIGIEFRLILFRKGQIGLGQLLIAEAPGSFQVLRHVQPAEIHIGDDGFLGLQHLLKGLFPKCAVEVFHEAGQRIAGIALFIPQAPFDRTPQIIVVGDLRLVEGHGVIVILVAVFQGVLRGYDVFLSGHFFMGAEIAVGVLLQQLGHGLVEFDIGVSGPVIPHLTNMEELMGQGQLHFIQLKLASALQRIQAHIHIGPQHPRFHLGIGIQLRDQIQSGGLIRQTDIQSRQIFVGLISHRSDLSHQRLVLLRPLPSRIIAGVKGRLINGVLRIHPLLDLQGQGVDLVVGGPFGQLRPCFFLCLGSLFAEDRVVLIADLVFHFRLLIDDLILLDRGILRVADPIDAVLFEEARFRRCGFQDQLFSGNGGHLIHADDRTRILAAGIKQDAVLDPGHIFIEIPCVVHPVGGEQSVQPLRYLQLRQVDAHGIGPRKALLVLQPGVHLPAAQEHDAGSFFHEPRLQAGEHLPGHLLDRKGPVAVHGVFFRKDAEARHGLDVKGIAVAAGRERAGPDLGGGADFRFLRLEKFQQEARLTEAGDGQDQEQGHDEIEDQLSVALLFHSSPSSPTASVP